MGMYDSDDASQILRDIKALEAEIGLWHQEFGSAMAPEVKAKHYSEVATLKEQYEILEKHHRDQNQDWVDACEELKARLAKAQDYATFKTSSFPKARDIRIWIQELVKILGSDK
jgi:hypothetical protein